MERSGWGMELRRYEEGEGHGSVSREGMEGKAAHAGEAREGTNQSGFRQSEENGLPWEALLLLNKEKALLNEPWVRRWAKRRECTSLYGPGWLVVQLGHVCAPERACVTARCARARLLPYNPLLRTRKINSNYPLMWKTLNRCGRTASKLTKFLQKTWEFHEMEAVVSGLLNKALFSPWQHLLSETVFK